MTQLSRRWMLSASGGAVLASILARCASANPPSSRTASLAQNNPANMASDWVLVENDFLGGIWANAEQEPDKYDPGRKFRNELRTAYYKRFVDRYAKLDVSLTRAQAAKLGQITKDMVDVEKHPKYYKQNAAATLDTYHLHWARDVVGFWSAGKPSDHDILGMTIRIQEFNNGCTLC